MASNSPLPTSVIKDGILKKRGGSNKDKGGNKKKWKSRYFILNGGSLYFYDTATDGTHKGVVHLKTCNIDEIPERESKKPFSFALRTETQDFWVAADSLELYQEWLKVLRENLGKPNMEPPERPRAKSFAFRAQKQMVEQVASSSVGKSVLKEYLPDDTWFILDAVKKMVTNISGEKKAKDIERILIKVAVKVAWLYRGKHLSGDEMMKQCREPVLKMWELFIDACEAKKRNIPNLVVSIRNAEAAFETLLKPHISSKSIQSMKEGMGYFSDEKTLTQLLTDERHQADLEKVASKLKILKSLFLWMGQ